MSVEKIETIETNIPTKEELRRLWDHGDDEVRTKIIKLARLLLQNKEENNPSATTPNENPEPTTTTNIK